MCKGIFDFNGDGKLDVFERAAECMFINEVLSDDEDDQTSDDDIFNDDDDDCDDF